MTRTSRRLIHLSRSLAVALLLWGAGALMSEAQAAPLSCAFTGGGVGNLAITLNNVNVIDTINNDMTANLPRLTCTTSGVQTVGLCLLINQGSAGGFNAIGRLLTTSGNPGGPSVTFAFFTDSGYNTVWLGTNAGTTIGPPGASGYSASATSNSLGFVDFGQIPIRVRIPPSQPAVNTGAYVTHIPQNGIVVRAATGTTGCGNLFSANTLPVTSPMVTVTANVVGSCQFKFPSYNLPFGTAGPIDTAIRPAVLNIKLDCTLNVDYKVGLDGGLFGGTNPQIRYMYKGGDKTSVYKILYGLYRNSTYTTGAGFGNVTSGGGANVFSGNSGAGGEQNIPVYGEVPAQTISTLGYGDYSDTVTITLSY